LNSKLSGCCSVCGLVLKLEACPYLLVAQPDAQRVAILRWNNALAARDHTRGACSPGHALEMVAHWMVSGRLDITFTRTADTIECNFINERKQILLPLDNPKPIGELVINHESVRKLVAKDPEALAMVLDSLLEVLQRDQQAAPRKQLASSLASASGPTSVSP